MRWPGTIQPARFLSHTGKVLPGVRRVVQVPNPAAGTDWTVTVPAGVQWFVTAGVAQLTTSATVDNRQVALEVTVNGSTVWYARNGTTHAASTIFVYNFSSTVANVPLSGTETGVLVSFPPGYLSPGTVIGTSTNLLQAGDQWSGIVLWIEEVYVTDSQLSEIQRERETLQRDIDIYEYEQAMQGQGA